MQDARWLVLAALCAGLVGCDSKKDETKVAGDAKAKAPAEVKADAKAPTEVKAPDAKAPDAKAPDAKAPAEVPAPTAGAPTGPVFVDGNIDLSVESVGELHPGMTAADVEAKLGKPAKASKIEEEGATGEFVQSWIYPDKGVEVGLTAATKTGPQTVRSLAADATCKLPLSWGLKIGSTRAEVEKIYGDHFEADTTTPEKFVAGSIYGGAIYTFADGKVTNLFLGAAAE